VFDLSSHIDLPFVWSTLIAGAIFLYVLLDGFDLGIGILFPFAPSDKCRDRMMNSVSPFWDGNETWLVFGGGGLFAAFPLAYSILLPAFYIPITIMLLGLILRGIAFEFRFKAEKEKRKIWDYSFHIGSITAALCQGIILGAFIEGIKVEGNHFSGGPFDWATGFSIMTGAAMVFGYALLGATWLIMKTEDVTQTWARKASIYSLSYVLAFMIIVSICMPFLDNRIEKIWFTLPNFLYLLPIPLATALMFIILWRDISSTREVRPFFLSMGLFLMGYIGILISMFPWIIPHNYNIWQAAASGPSLSLLLVGTSITLPLILGYTGYCYYVFRGKATHEHMY
jgi:cytochrome d ubiquinol oxidase subunit II